MYYGKQPRIASPNNGALRVARECVGRGRGRAGGGTEYHVTPHLSSEKERKLEKTCEDKTGLRQKKHYGKQKLTLSLPRVAR